MITAPTLIPIQAADLQSRFLAILPRIQARARIYFRDIKCAFRKADLVSEVVAVSWKWFTRLLRRGKDARRFVNALATLAARAVRCGRRACGQERSNDVLNPVAQRRHNFVVQSISPTRQSLDATRGHWLEDVIAERLVDNTITPPPEQAAFRIDFPRWMKTLSVRERRILRAMSRNEKTKDLSRKFEVSAGRISQIRREFHDGWSRFVGDLDERTVAA
jgi:hypothetical protein